MGASEELQHAALLRDLGATERVPVGTRMHVEEDGFIYTGVGQTTPEIIGHIGWKLANIWMPDHVETGILLKHGVFPDPVVAAQVILTDPLSVHHDRRGQGFIYFLIAAGVVESRQFLADTCYDSFTLRPSTETMEANSCGRTSRTKVLRRSHFPRPVTR